MKAFHLFILSLFVNLCSAQIEIKHPFVENSVKSDISDIKLIYVAIDNYTIVGVKYTTIPDLKNGWIAISKQMTLSYSNKETEILQWGFITEKGENQRLEFDTKYPVQPNSENYIYLAFQAAIPSDTKIISIH